MLLVALYDPRFLGNHILPPASGWFSPCSYSSVSLETQCSSLLDGNTTILTGLDRFYKAPHFISLTMLPSAAETPGLTCFLSPQYCVCCFRYFKAFDNLRSPLFSKLVCSNSQCNECDPEKILQISSVEKAKTAQN